MLIDIWCLVAGPGGVDPDPTLKNNLDPDPIVKKKPDPDPGPTLE